MKKITWEIQYHDLPVILKYCKKCGKKNEFICSKQFRINAQRKYLDIWLIYKCIHCDTTWNATIFSRISPQSFHPQLLEDFCKNEETLAEYYATNSSFFHDNGVEMKLPHFSIIGDDFPLDELVEVEIKNIYPFPIKVSSLVKKKLHLSQKEYLQLIAEGKMKSVPQQDLQKYRLKHKIILVFC